MTAETLTDRMLFADRIPEPLDNYRTAFFLAEKDSILDAKRTARYLRDHGVKRVEERGNLRYLHGLAHGQCFTLSTRVVLARAHDG